MNYSKTLKMYFQEGRKIRIKENHLLCYLSKDKIYNVT